MGFAFDRRFPRPATALAIGPAVSLLVLAGCASEGDGPEGGQTGSPVVPPDYETPVPFRPPPEGPPTQGPSPELPHRPLGDPKRLAAFEGALYAATPRGVFVFDAADPGAPQMRRALVEDALPHFVGVDGSRLTVIASGFPDDAALAEHGLVTRVVSFDLSQDPLDPRPLGGLELPGGPPKPQNPM
jgi:hypothetical protein